MNPAPDVLAGLRDIHLPEAISYWPPAPGWWIALLCLVSLVCWAESARRRRARSPERVALRELEQLAASFARERQGTLLASGLSNLLRRVSLARFDAVQVAALYGRARAASLSAHAGTPAISAEWVERFEEVAYAGPTRLLEPGEGEAWVDAVRAFLVGPVRRNRFTHPRRFRTLWRSPRTEVRQESAGCVIAESPTADPLRISGSLTPVGGSS
jgi:hypothetical protein